MTVEIPKFLTSAQADLVRETEPKRMDQLDEDALLEEFRIVDVARKVVGVGSVGTRAWIVLLLGRDGNDPLFLQVKEAQASVLTAFVGPKRRVSNGRRVVEGQHLMQAASDIFLGWTDVVGNDDVKRDYYFRQLRDWKGSAVVETLESITAEVRAIVRASDPATAIRPGVAS